MLGIVSIVFLNLFAGASGWCLVSLGKRLGRLRTLTFGMEPGRRNHDQCGQVIYTETPPCTLLDAREFVVGTSNPV
jgi:hypothetical protein